VRTRVCTYIHSLYICVEREREREGGRLWCVRACVRACVRGRRCVAANADKEVWVTAEENDMQMQVAHTHARGGRRPVEFRVARLVERETRRRRVRPTGDLYAGGPGARANSVRRS
jgi:hypothetical protein